MKRLKEKLSKNGGFTLVEMLIVVAIIAILIAVSIPLVNGALERARDATDQANERAAKAEALLYFMGTVDDDDFTYTPGTKLEAYYDAQNGKLVGAETGSTAPKSYGQCTGQTDCYESKIDGRAVSSHVGDVIKVTVETTGETKIEWVTGT